MEKWREDVLAHHGIKGQSWGKKNGPPYPLNPANRSAEEKNKNGNSYTSSWVKYYKGNVPMTDTGTRAKGSSSDSKKSVKKSPMYGKFKNADEVIAYMKSGVAPSDGETSKTKKATGSSKKASGSSKKTVEKDPADDKNSGKAYYDKHYPLGSKAWEKLKSSWANAYSGDYTDAIGEFSSFTGKDGEQKFIDKMIEKVFPGLSEDKVPKAHIKDFYKYAMKQVADDKVKGESTDTSAWRTKKAELMKSFVDSKFLDDNYDFQKSKEEFSKKIKGSKIESSIASDKQLNDLYESLREYRSTWVNKRDNLFSSLRNRKVFNKDSKAPDNKDELIDVLSKAGLYRKDYFSAVELDKIVELLKQQKEESLKHSEISHHGIKGQRWGIKNGPSYPLSRAQRSASEKRKNGSISKSGKERYGKDGVSSNPDSESHSGKKSIDLSKATEETKNQNENSNNKTLENIKSRRSANELSDTELREAIDRANLEKQYKNLSSEKEFRRSDKARQAEDLVGSGLSAVNKTTMLASSISKIVGSEEIQGKLAVASLLTGATNKVFNQGKNVRDRVNAIRSDNYKKNLDTSSMSNEELRNGINRMSLEKAYTSAIGDPTYSEGMAKTKRYLDVYNDAASLGNTVASTVNAYRGLTKKKSSKKETSESVKEEKEIKIPESKSSKKDEEWIVRESEKKTDTSKEKTYSGKVEGQPKSNFSGESSKSKNQDYAFVYDADDSEWRIVTEDYAKDMGSTAIVNLIEDPAVIRDINRLLEDKGAA